MWKIPEVQIKCTFIKKYPGNDCTAYGATHGAPAYTEPNNASDCKYNIETKESDKYTAYGRYKTGDCYCVSCQLEDLARGSDSYESNSNKGWSGWVSE